MGNCYSAVRLPAPPGAPGVIAAEPRDASRTRVKLVLCGEAGVGKSCLALRYVHGSFENRDPTVGAAFLSHTTTLASGATITFDIWDTAGQERYRSLAPLYYRGAQAAVVVYDISNQASFDKCRYWAQELIASAQPNQVILLVGNKADLEEQRVVSPEQGRAFADSAGFLFLEASARTGAQVSRVFETVATQLSGGLPISTKACAA